MRLAIKDVTVDPTVQLRDGLDMDRVRAMQEFEEQGGHLPPVTVVGSDNLLADGFHRLEAADSSGRTDIDVDRVAGDRDDAIALAIQLNDAAVHKPLTRAEVNKGVRLLLAAGWSVRQIAARTGVSSSTVSNIGQAAKQKRALAPQVASKLGDTMLVRIAEMVEPEHQAEFAAAVATVPHPTDPKKSGLPEAKVRQAAAKLKTGAFSPTEAVEAVAAPHAMPKGLSDVATLAYKRLDYFLTEPMTVNGRALDFWQVLEVLAEHRAEILQPAVNTLVTKLTEVSARTDHYATALRSGKALKEVSA